MESCTYSQKIPRSAILSSEHLQHESALKKSSDGPAISSEAAEHCQDCKRFGMHKLLCCCPAQGIALQTFDHSHDAPAACMSNSARLEHGLKVLTVLEEHFLTTACSCRDPCFFLPGCDQPLISLLPDVLMPPSHWQGYEVNERHKKNEQHLAHRAGLRVYWGVHNPGRPRMLQRPLFPMWNTHQKLTIATDLVSNGYDWIFQEDTAGPKSLVAQGGECAGQWASTAGQNCRNLQPDRGSSPVFC